MSIPEVIENIQDGALGVQQTPSDDDVMVVGACTSGTANTIYAFTDSATLKTALVSGPAVDLAALLLSKPGHGTVYVTPITASAAGTAGSVTPVRFASSTGTVATTGSVPNDAYNVIVTIVTGEASVAGGGGVFTYSVDGGYTTSAQIAIPTGGTYVVPGTGITLVFAGASTAFDAGDKFTFTTTAPGYSASDVTAAFTAIFADQRTWKFAALAGAASAAGGSATIASTLDSLMQTAAASFRYTRALMQCADDTDANIKTAFTNFTSATGRVAVCAGYDDQQSLLTGRTMKRGSLGVIAQRLMTARLAEDPGRVASGPLSGLVKLYRDEAGTPALDAARFITLRTIINKTGFFVTSGRTMAPVGSDYSYIPNGIVMDKICTATRTVLVEELNNDLEANDNTVQSPLVPGAIDELEARRIEKKAIAFIRTQIGNNAKGITVKINRSTNLLTTATLNVQVRATPKGYARAIVVDIGFASPLFTLSTAA